MVDSRVRSLVRWGTLSVDRRSAASAAADQGHRGIQMGENFKRKRDDGASLVEFALLMPLLLLLVLGIIEFGFILGQFNEVRHGAHEGARLAAVNDSDPHGRACDAMGLGSDASVTFTSGSYQIGDQASVTVTKSVQSLSGVGFITALLPNNLSTTADFRIEQPTTLPAGGSCA
jgi:Flp pilus assembly protein TadG